MSYGRHKNIDKLRKPKNSTELKKKMKLKTLKRITVRAKAYRQDSGKSEWFKGPPTHYGRHSMSLVS